MSERLVVGLEVGEGDVDAVGDAEMVEGGEVEGVIVVD